MGRRARWPRTEIHGTCCSLPQLVSVRGHCAEHRHRERLSGLDASFLYIESPTQPLDVCSILEPDTSTVPGGYTFDRLRGELASRIAAIPEFRAKLADSQLNLDYPVWVEDDAFDLDRHLLRLGLSFLCVRSWGLRVLWRACACAPAPRERD